MKVLAWAGSNRRLLRNLLGVLFGSLFLALERALLTVHSLDVRHDQARPATPATLLLNHSL